MSLSKSPMFGSRLYKPSDITPIAPTTWLFLYRGMPPGSADSPSGERFGPIVTAELFSAITKSEHGS